MSDNKKQNDKNSFIKIPGQIMQNTLPKGTSLVLEGGGLRGYYSSGVMEAFMEKSIMFPYIIGVSAGAANALSYISGQPMRSRSIIERYVTTPKYVSKRNLIFRGSLFNFDYIFGEIPEKRVFFDWDIFRKQQTRFLTGALNCEDGKTVWFEKEDVTFPFEASQASCSIPFLTKVKQFKGYNLVDGGMSSPIPIDKAIEDGNTFHVIVLTRNEGYRKAPASHTHLLHMASHKYPAIEQVMLHRHEVYNRQLELCEKLEREGKAVIIRPLEPIKVKRDGADLKTLLALHDEGLEEGREALKKILPMLSSK